MRKYAFINLNRYLLFLPTSDLWHYWLLSIEDQINRNANPKRRAVI